MSHPRLTVPLTVTVPTEIAADAERRATRAKDVDVETCLLDYLRLDIQFDLPEK